MNNFTTTAADITYSINYARKKNPFKKIPENTGLLAWREALSNQTKYSHLSTK